MGATKVSSKNLWLIPYQLTLPRHHWYSQLHLTNIWIEITCTSWQSHKDLWHMPVSQNYRPTSLNSGTTSLSTQQNPLWKGIYTLRKILDGVRQIWHQRRILWIKVLHSHNSWYSHKLAGTCKHPRHQFLQLCKAIRLLLALQISPPKYSQTWQWEWSHGGEFLELLTSYGIKNRPATVTNSSTIHHPAFPLHHWWPALHFTVWRQQLEKRSQHTNPGMDMGHTPTPSSNIMVVIFS